MRKFFIFICLAIIFFGLRAYRLNQDLLFHRDQGLHSLAIWDIYQEGHLSLLGHPSDVDGLFHAPIYYWLMIPGYAISGGDPSGAAIYLVLLEALSLPFLFIAIKKFLGERTAWISLVLYTASYLMVSSSRWLVNVTPILGFTNFLLYLFSRKTTAKTSFFIGLVIGSIAQFNAAIGPFLMPSTLIYLYIKNKRLIPITIFGFLIPASPLILFDFRHNHVITNAVLGFLTSSQGTSGLSFIPNLKSFISQIGIIFVPTVPLLGFIIFCLGIFSLWTHRQQKFLIWFVLLPLIFWSLLKRGTLPFFFTPLYIYSIIIVSHFLSRLNNILLLLSISLLVFFNLSQDVRIYTPTNALIPIGDQNVITLGDRLEVVDYLYQQSDLSPFSVWFYNLPYFQDFAWNYIFQWHAKSLWGFLPERTSSFDKKDLQSSKYFYAVYETDHDRPDRLSDWIGRTVDQFGPILKTTKFRDLTVLQFAKIKED